MRFSGVIYRTLFLKAILCALIAGGCNSLQTSGIDPSGEHVIAGSTAPLYPTNVNPTNPAFPPLPSPYNQPGVNPTNQAAPEQPVIPLPNDPVTIILTPSVTVAPVGSEVILIAGVGSADGYLRCNQRLEWAVAPGTVGQFTDIGKNDFVDIILGDYNKPRIVNGASAIGSTASKDVQVKQAANLQPPVVSVTSGQGWIKISSPIEGTSTVNVSAPKIVKPDQRTKSATIYWTDVTWRFPPPSINSAGSKHFFTTTVMRQSNQYPLSGWIVKYTIVGGPEAGFSPDGGQTIEVPTDEAGQAKAEIFQKTPAHGTNQIAIDVIRPAELPGAGGQRMTVGSGSAMQTWTASDIAVKLTGQAMAKTGDTFTYQIEVSNPGDLPSKNIIVSNTLPDNVTYQSSNPPAQIFDKRLQWPVAELGPRQRQTIELSVRAEREGIANNCAEAATASGLKVSDCASTTITGIASNAAAPSGGSQGAVSSTGIDLQLLGPNSATVGSEVVFDIILKNNTQSNYNNLLIKDRFDPGLEHTASKEKHVIEYPLGDLPARKQVRIPLTFRVSKAGNLSNTVEIIRQDQMLAQKQITVPVSANGAPIPGIASPGGQDPARSNPQSTPGTSFGQQPDYGSQGIPDYRRGSQTASPPASQGGVPGINIKHTVQARAVQVENTADFIVQINNPNNRPLTNLKLVYQFDPVFVPTEATDGYKVVPADTVDGKKSESVNLMWLLPGIQANGAYQIVVRCKCVKPSSKAGNIATVSTAEGSQNSAEAFLEITAPPGMQLPENSTPPGKTQGDSSQSGGPSFGDNRYSKTQDDRIQSSGDLAMTITDLRDPVNVGKDLTYEIRVVNNGTAVQRRVTVVATAPNNMSPIPLGTIGPGLTKFVIEGEKINFNPVMEVQPGETLVYRVRVRTKTAGQLPFRAELTSQTIDQPIVKEETTDVF